MKLNPVNKVNRYYSAEEFISMAKGMYKLPEAQKEGFKVYAKETNNYYKLNVKDFIPILNKYLDID